MKANFVSDILTKFVRNLYILSNKSIRFWVFLSELLLRKRLPEELLQRWKTIWIYKIYLSILNRKLKISGSNSAPLKVIGESLLKKFHPFTILIPVKLAIKVYFETFPRCCTGLIGYKWNRIGCLRKTCCAECVASHKAISHYRLGKAQTVLDRNLVLNLTQRLKQRCHTLSEIFVPKIVQ